MGIKRTIDSGRKDKKGRPIKVSGNSLAASDNVNSKKSQLAQSVPQRDGSKYREVFDSVGKLDIPMRITHNGDISTTHDLANDFARGGNGEDYQIEFDGLGDYYEKQVNLRTMFPDWDGCDDIETEDGFIVSKKGLFTDGENIVNKLKNNEANHVFDNLKKLRNKSCLDKKMLKSIISDETKDIVPIQDWKDIAKKHAQNVSDTKRKSMSEQLDQLVSDGMIYGDNLDKYDSYEDYVKDKRWSASIVNHSINDMAADDFLDTFNSTKAKYNNFASFVANNRHKYMNDEENGLSPESVKEGAVSMFLKGYR